MHEACGHRSLYPDRRQGARQPDRRDQSRAEFPVDVLPDVGYDGGGRGEPIVSCHPVEWVSATPRPSFLPRRFRPTEKSDTPYASACSRGDRLHDGVPACRAASRVLLQSLQPEAMSQSLSSILLSLVGSRTEVRRKHSCRVYIVMSVTACWDLFYPAPRAIKH